MKTVETCGFRRDRRRRCETDQISVIAPEKGCEDVAMAGAASFWSAREKWGGRWRQGWLEAGLATTSLTILEPNPSCEIAALAAARGVELNP